MNTAFEAKRRPALGLYGARRAEACRRPAVASQRGCERADKPIAQTTVVAANVELGQGASLFIRGQGGNLRWDRGRPLTCIGPRRWVWSASGVKERVEFQLLLNDQVWARGENLVLGAGEKIEVAPDFEWPEIPRTS